MTRCAPLVFLYRRSVLDQILLFTHSCCTALVQLVHAVFLHDDVVTNNGMTRAVVDFLKAMAIDHTLLTTIWPLITHYLLLSGH